MSVPFFVVAIAIALIVAGAAEASARASSRRAEAERDKAPPKPVDPARFAAAVKKAVAYERDPAKLDQAASKLEAAGQPAAAAAARELAATLRAGGAKSTTAPALVGPFPDVPAKAWNRYVRLMSIAEPGTVSSGNQLGMFQIGFRRLADLGYVENLRGVDKNGRKVWVGDFKAPYSLSAFLKDPVLQYQVFVQVTKADRAAVLARHRDVIGKSVAGRKATLSGLLGAAYHAGLAGLGRWLSSDQERTRAPRTTAVYQRTAGLF